MNITAAIVIGFIIVVLAFYLRLKASINKSVMPLKSLLPMSPTVRCNCFSCGMVVPAEKALEKKGRYFCGVKRNDRDGNPVKEKRP